MATTVRRATLTLPVAPVGPDSPLPALRAPRDVHSAEPPEGADIPADMARQLGHEPLRSLLPVRMRDGYGRERAPAEVDALVIENDRLCATVLPGFGGRVYSLRHKDGDKGGDDRGGDTGMGRGGGEGGGRELELLYRNPVLQPADFALNGAWFSGGIEWNIGATGHTTLTCAPLHAARVAAPDGGQMLRLWEWERLRDLPFQVDLWLPEGSDFLYAGVRIRNPHDHTAPVYWWSNTAVPEAPGTRVLAPADSAWHFGYERALRRVPVPVSEGVDRTYPLLSEFPADYFYDIEDGARRWVASVDGAGRGLVQTSTGTLRGRKLFFWGAGRGGRRWQRWLTEPGGGAYAEIQAGLARTQLEHIPLEAGGEFAWLEAYGPIATDPAAVHGDDWRAARAEVAARLEESLPRADVDAAFAAWRPYADRDPAPSDSLAVGSGWGALEAARAGYDLPGTPFDKSTLGPGQRPWLELLATGDLPEEGTAPGPTPVAPPWRDLLESASSAGHADYHLGVAQWHAGDRAQAVRSWERALNHAGAGSRWAPLYCLAVAEGEAGESARAADRHLESFDSAHAEGPSAPLVALAREAVPALLAAGRPADAARVLDRLPPADRSHGRIALLRAQVLLALGEVAAAREIFDGRFEVADLREGEEALGDTWNAIAERLVAGDAPVTDAVRARARAEHPLPDHYDFRMRPR